MKRSFSYSLVTLILKLKGVKKLFSTAPVDYIKLRKEDIKRPKGIFYKKNSSSFKVLASTITEISSNNESKKVVIFLPGGAFVSGPAKHHWDTVKKIQQQTGYTIWLCDYPKAPEHKITQISTNIDAVYKAALIKYNDRDIVLIGDSVGGTLSIALVQRLIKEEKKLPQKIILISPVLDATMSNKAIDDIDKVDVMLAKKGVLSAKKMCVANDDLKAPEISPIYGDFRGFPETIICLATQDIMYPDEQIMVKKLKENRIDYKIILGERMPHIWPLLPVMKEAKLALIEIIKILKK